MANEKDTESSVDFDLPPIITVASFNNEQSSKSTMGGIIAQKSFTATKTDTPLIKTPQSITVITRDQIESQNVTSVIEALRYSSGVVSGMRGSSNRSDEMIVRGVGYAPKYLDGLSYGAGSGKIEPWLLERVELIKGPASALYGGQSNPGGLVNMVSKRPTNERIRTIKLAGGNYDTVLMAADFGGPLTESNSVLYRFSIIGLKNNTEIRHVKEERVAIAPSLTFQLSEQTRLTLLTSHQRDPKAGYRNFYPAEGTRFSVPGIGYLPHDLDMSDPSFNQSKRVQTSFGYEFEHLFSDALAFRQNMRYSNIRQDYKYLVYLFQRQNDPTVLIRRPQKERSRDKDIVIDNQLNLLLKSGNIEHNVLVGIDYALHHSEYTRWVGSSRGFDLDWRDPIYGGLLIDDNRLPMRSNTKQKLSQVGFYLQDQITIGAWNIALSGRYDWSKVKTNDRLYNERRAQTDKKFSGRAGVLYALENGLSPYISYSTSFTPNLDSGAPGAPPFKPTTAYQQEVGLKYQPSNNFMLNVALFELNQKNITTYNSEIFYNEQIGKVRSRGLEVETRANVHQSFEVMAAYTYNDVKTRQSSNKKTEGKVPTLIPKHSASLWGHYYFGDNFLPGLTLGTGVRYVGKSYGVNTNEYKVPSFTLVDLMVSYDLGRHSTELSDANLQFNISNIADKKYVSACGGRDACFLGNRRKASLSLTIDF